MTIYTAKADIPHYRQPVGSKLCGDACLKMLYGMYGIETNIFSIRDEMQKNRGSKMGGSLIFETGLHLLQNGFLVEICAWPSFENKYACKLFGTMDQKQLLGVLKLIAAKANVSQKLEFKMLFRFMEEGGIFTPKIVSFREIRERLMSGIITRVNYSYHLSNVLPYYCSINAAAHFVVPTEMNGRKITILDPAAKEPIVFNKEEFLFMFHNADAATLFVNGTK